MAGIDKKTFGGAAGQTGQAGIVPWSLANNGGTGSGITPSNGAKSGVTPNVKIYQADAGETFDVDVKQQNATTAVYTNNAPGKLKDGTSKSYADNAIVGGPANPQYMGVPNGSPGLGNSGKTDESDVYSPSPIKGNDQQYSELGE